MGRVAERLFAGAGFVAVLYCGLVWAGACRSAHEAAAFDKRVKVAAEEHFASPDDLSASSSEAGLHQTSNPALLSPHVIGRIEIPELDLSAPITDGIGDSELRHGVGHVPGTALPGGLGTMGLAGHRDTYFRRLRRVRDGMQIIVRGTHGVFRYQIDSTEIVMPEQVDVLDVVDRPGLALVTCYPFEFIGAAPKRFIVHAHLLSVDPGSD